MSTKDNILNRPKLNISAPSPEAKVEAADTPITQAAEQTSLKQTTATEKQAAPTTQPSSPVNTAVGSNAVSHVVERADKPLANLETPKTIDSREKQYTYADMVKYLNDKSDEDIEKERKRARRRQIFSAIGDGVSALANLYYTSKGALDSYKPSESMGKNNMDRWDAYRKELQGRNDKRNADIIAAAKLDDETRRYVENLRNQRADKEREYQLKVNADMRANAKADRDAAKAELDKDLMLGKIDRARYEAERARINSEYADELNRTNIETKKSQAARNYASARKAGSGGGSTKYYGQFATEDSDNTKYKTSADYTKSAIDEARKVGIPTTKEVEYYDSYGTDGRGIGLPKKKTVQRKATEIAADLDEYYRKHPRTGRSGSGVAVEKDEDNTPPTRKKNKEKDEDNTPPSRRK